MKLFVAIVLLASVAYTLAGHHGGGGGPFGPGEGFKECMEKAGLEMKDMKPIFQKLKSGEALDSELQNKIGCSHQCMLEKRGVWKDGGVDAAAMEEQMENMKMLDKVPNAKDVIRECATKKGSDDCDTGFQIMKCMKDSFPFPPPPKS